MVNLKFNESGMYMTQQLGLSTQDNEVFDAAWQPRRQKIYEFIREEQFQRLLKPPHLQSATFSYPNRPGKALRGTGALLSCGAAGGDERELLALPVAAATEMHHMWGLIHDDIIDEDEYRRGGLTVHAEYKKVAEAELAYDSRSAERYGLTLGILAGDAAFGLIIVYLTRLFEDPRINPAVAQLIIKRYAEFYVPAALEGQTLDVQYEKVKLSSLTQDNLLHVSLQKTGTFFGLGGFMGSLIGVNEPNIDHPYVKTLTEFTTRCGIVLQITDDLLNIVGNTKDMGKAVGSDVLLGKNTLPIVYALDKASSIQSEQIMMVYGNPHASPEDLETALQLIDVLGGVSYTRDLASKTVREAITSLALLPQSQYTKFLELWARRILERVG